MCNKKKPGSNQDECRVCDAHVLVLVQRLSSSRNLTNSFQFTSVITSVILNGDFNPVTATSVPAALMWLDKRVRQTNEDIIIFHFLAFLMIRRSFWMSKQKNKGVIPCTYLYSRRGGFEGFLTTLNNNSSDTWQTLQKTSHTTIIFLQLYDNQYEVKSIEIIT